MKRVVAQPSRLRVRAASRRPEKHGAWTPRELAGEDACATMEDLRCKAFSRLWTRVSKKSRLLPSRK